MFLLSRLAGLLLQPSTILAAVVALGALLSWTRWWRTGRLLASAGLIVLAAIACLPIATLATAPLEERFARAELAAAPDGIIVLSGAIRPELSLAHDAPQLNEAAERMTVFLELALRYPAAKLVFSGGSAALRPGGPTESLIARRLLASLGLPIARVAFEDRSRNTYENAVYSLALVHPAPEERWVLITTAMDMPRAIGVFWKIGWHVEPWPVDFHTSGAAGFSLDPFGNMELLDHAAHEWIGLAAYRLLGRTDAFFPGP